MGSHFLTNELDKAKNITTFYVLQTRCLNQVHLLHQLKNWKARKFQTQQAITCNKLYQTPRSVHTGKGMQQEERETLVSEIPSFPGGLGKQAGLMGWVSLLLFGLVSLESEEWADWLTTNVHGLSKISRTARKRPTERKETYGVFCPGVEVRRMPSLWLVCALPHLSAHQVYV